MRIKIIQDTIDKLRKKDLRAIKKLRDTAKKNNLGANSYMNQNSFVYNKETTIGKFCSIAENVKIGVSSHPTNWLSTHPFQYTCNPLVGKELAIEPTYTYENCKPCHIGNDVWIGINVTIRDGITIGDGAIIAAHQFVSKNVPPYAIFINNKVYKYRFSEEIIKDLLELKWWDLDNSIIKTLPFDNVEECIKIINEKKKEEIQFNLQ